MPKMTLDETQKNSLVGLVRYFASTFPREALIRKHKEIDQAYHMEINKEIAEESKTNKRDVEETTDRFVKSDTPLVRKQVQSEIPFMENIFLSDDPIFAVVKSGLEQEDDPQVEGINSKLRQDSQVGKWQLELSKVILSAVKYNICACEVYWDNKVIKRKARTMESGTALTTKSVEWAGNRIKALSPYNILFDTSVEPHCVAEEGEFFIHVDHLSQTRLANLIENLKQQVEADPQRDVYLDTSAEVWKLSTANAAAHTQDNLWYEIPEVTDRPNKKGDATNWMEVAGYSVEKGKESLGRPGTTYHLIKAYVRLIPVTLGIRSSGDSGSIPQVWAIYIIGGNHILAVVPETNSHGLIPVGLGTPDIDTLGIHGRSSVGCTVALQKLIGEFMERRLASIDRSISDRAIVDDRYMDTKQFKQRIPDAKYTPNSRFAAKPNLKLSDIYYPISFNDTTASLLTIEIPFLSNLAEETNLSNASRFGKFQKGNKTPDEVRETMANAEAPLLRRALQLEMQVFSVIKTILQSNLLDYAEPEEIADQKFDPETLLEKTLKFRIAGGLDPLAIAMKQGLLEEIFYLAQTNPLINERYDLMRLFEDLYYGKGLELSRYRIDPAQQVAGANPGGAGAGDAAAAALTSGGAL